MRGKGAQFKVVKNNFARIAFARLEASNVSKYLVGPTAVTVAPKDSNEVAIILFDFAKEVPALQIKGALIGKDVYDAAAVESFSKLPGKLELIYMNLAAALNDINGRLVRTVKAIADKKAESAA